MVKPKKIKRTYIKWIGLITTILLLLSISILVTTLTNLLNENLEDSTLVIIAVLILSLAVVGGYITLNWFTERIKDRI